MNIEAFGETLLVDGIQLTSAVDREREARVQAECLIPADAEEAWIYGPALGDIVRLLLERATIKRLNVVVMNRELTNSVWPEHVFGWIGDRVKFSHASDHEIPSMPFVASPAELRLAEESAWPLRDRVMALVNKPFNEFVQKELAVHWEKQEADNAPLIASDGRVQDLFGKDTRDAIVVAGGPSAGEFYDWIYERQGSHVIIAASTAMEPLRRVGIIPDFVVVIDRLPIMAKHFGGDLSEFVKTKLVYLTSVWPAILKAWHGLRYSVRERELYPGGSVVHAEVDLAVQMGARTVNLFGVDFCFPGARTHVDGAAMAAPVDERQKFRCVNGYGEQSFTDEALTQYRRTLEDLIELRPAVDFVKFGRAGVALKGARWNDEERGRDRRVA